ncbi:MAG: serine/threonine protein phosphatase [Halobacteriovoraceae bacterium]|nr:serine/threonine protein phosphatase [Halobacteriovoraceae bacterium]|tara:strand:- start:55602 stop:56345 length:744 start_codon:yes stop_codon:yes gene_type:complete
MGLISSGLTHIGMKRKTNQDAIYLNPKKHLFIVADGMGGHNGGDIASQMAVSVIPEFVLENYGQDPIKLQKQAIAHANSSIKKRGEEDKNLVGMGTTVVSQLFRGPNLYTANVGDSRAYLFNNKRIYQLTSDHSLVQEKLNLGFYTREQAGDDPQKNVLVRTVGFESEVEADVFNYKVHRNDIFLSCSDGLHGKVSDSDLSYIINHFIPDPSKATQEQVDHTAQFLVDLANKNGGQDNISVILIIAQ